MNGRFLLRGALLIGAWVPLLCEPAWAQDEHAGHSAREHFGGVHFPISCSQDAQRQFDRAVAILHSFFYPETVKAFSAIAQAAALAGHKAQARLHYEQLLVLARDADSVRAPLKAAREFLAKH